MVYRTAPRDERPRAKHLAELRGMKIGPAFPRDPEAGPVQGMRGVPRRATKAPYRYGRQRTRKPVDNVSILCRLCPFKVSGRTWRPTKRRAAEHAARKHRAASL